MSLMGFEKACVFGPPGSGKTTDLGRACPNGALIGEEGAFRPLVTVLGLDEAYIEERFYQREDIRDVTKLLQQMTSEKWGIEGAVVDDIYTKAKVVADEFCADPPRNEKGFPDIRTAWGNFATVMAQFVLAVNRCPFPVYMSSHEAFSKIDEKTARVIKGGPKLPSQPQVEPFCYQLTTILKCGMDEKHVLPWRGIYKCAHGDKQQIMKARFYVHKNRAPQCLAEHMRHAGLPVPRALGLEWMEDYVETCAGAWTAGDKFKDIQADLDSLDVLPEHRAWIRDEGYARATIRKQHADYLRGLE